MNNAVVNFSLSLEDFQILHNDNELVFRHNFHA
jgi:hypothetical protein